MDVSEKYWFYAKRHGFGWSLPSSWQGWVVLVIYLAALGILAHFLPPATNLVLFSIGAGVATVILCVVLWRKAEPLHWPWGKR